MSGRQDGNVTFEEALQLLKILGYVFRQNSGSHIIAGLPDVRGMLTMQPRKDGKAKGYQLDQMREHIRINKLDRLE